MLRWLWLEPSERHELQRYVDQADTSDAPAWFASAYAQARQYRMARSRRWLPSAELLVRKRSVPTARHSNILSAISERRAQREARVRAFLDEKRSS